MDMTLISILLIMIGVILIALIGYIIHLKRQRQQFAELSDITDIFDEEDNSEILAIRDVPASQRKQDDIAYDQNKKYPIFSDKEEILPEEPAIEGPILQTPSAVLVIYVMAKNNMEFVGYELLQTLLASGFRFGEMSIFHRHEQLNGNGQVLFSLAGATEPGIFDINRIGAVRCQGLSLFMRLTSKAHNQTTLNLMLDTAYQLAEELDGLVLSAQKEPLTHDIVSTFKQKVEQHLSDLN